MTAAASGLTLADMLELVAQGPEPDQRWRQELASGRSYVLGRAAEADLPVPWDRGISRRHLVIEADGARLTGSVLPDARNPVFVDGEAREAVDLGPGGRFAIGGTTFVVRGGVTPQVGERPPVEQATFDPQTLRAVRFDDADRRMEVLTRLPDVILGTASAEELNVRLVDLILTGIPNADAAAIVAGRDAARVRILHQDRRRPLAGELRPSGRLAADAVRSGRSVLHVWECAGDGDGRFTAAAGFDWAFCTPLPLAGDAPAGLYVTGRLDGEAALPAGSRRAVSASLQADVKFAELVAEILRSVLRLNDLERQTAGLRQFLAPPILAALGEGFDAKLLEPRECDATVLFCDLRGFSAKAESAGRDLLGLLDRVSRALGLMTRSILTHGGVTGDFLGDAALAFWGWPFSSERAPVDACRAALAIRREFAAAAADPDHPLRDFRVGVGVAHGPSVAGKIGTAEQVKFTVFGPVVNLASRLEGMTKQLRVPILLDEATAAVVRERLPAEEGRVRRLARVMPYGSERPLVVSELVPPVSETPELSDADLAAYEAAVDAFTAGRWDEAYRMLHRLPPEDRAPDFLNQLITANNRVPPAGWDGVIRLPTK